jgi:hypothetical protein
MNQDREIAVREKDAKRKLCASTPSEPPSAHITGLSGFLTSGDRFLGSVAEGIQKSR